MASNNENDKTRKPVKDLEPDLDSEQEDESDDAPQNVGLRGEEELDEIFSQRAVDSEQLEDPLLTEDESDGEPEDQKAQPEPSRRGKPRDAKQLMLVEVKERAFRANERLRAQLTGSIVLDIKDKNQKFLFDWRADKPIIEELSAPPAAGADECTIHLSQSDFLRIASGELNPQVAMLSHKVSVEGKLNLAVYFFNLVSPY